MDLSKDVLDEIRLGVLCGYANRTQVFDSILDLYWEELGMIAEPIPTQPNAVKIVANDPTNDAINGRVRAAIDEAFARKAEEMKSWPAVTDCERLRNAFDALDKQGIVALEHVGFTQDDGGAIAGDVALARDALGGGKSRGCCFFTWQDTASAAKGGTLLLSYGSYEAEPPTQPVTPPPPCPACKGRGWIAASDPSQFPKQCTRCLVAAPPAPAPVLTVAQKVGAAVLDACREAGLVAHWNGSAGSRVELPRFRWQRRIAVPRATDIQDFIESWELELRAGRVSDSEILTYLEERAGDWFADFTDFGPDLLRRLRDDTEKFMDRERAREATWTEPTVNDRIDAAFDELRMRGLLAFGDIATTIQDGWALAGVKAVAGERGAVFFHQEDVVDGVGGLGLGLAFGTFETDPAENDAASLALGHEIVSVLEAHGVAAEWSRSVRDRIRVLPFDWKKRRWTKASPHERVAAAASAAPAGPETATAAKPSVWGRLFGQTKVSAEVHEPDTRVARSEQRKLFVERGFSTVVQARRSTAGFDLRLSRKLRAAWQSLGVSEPGHVCHLGVPHTFVRAGEHTTLAAQSAVENIREEAIPLRESGARAANARKTPGPEAQP